MNKLSKYNNTTVRILCESGETFTGACEWDDAEYNRDEFGVEKESLRIGEYIFFEDNILEIELLRGEVCIPVRDWPEAWEEIAVWFHERWHVPLEAYRESIRSCLGEESGIPQWYVVVRKHKIIAGCGVIENDFHERKDLAPNVCAVYVDEEYRNQGIAGFLLQYVCDDMAAMGIDTLYLLTDHTGFYERYGWEFLCMVKGSDEELSRMYVHKTGVS
ncbi:MAG: GNAT family N-acetyltransferase [Lachnospiraceae bacterium]|nr:GNAT family N-acetyltransferase [Lachnospiraceae bacterium]